MPIRKFGRRKAASEQDLTAQIAEAENRQAEKLAAFEQARGEGTLADLMADTPSVMDRARERGYGKFRQAEA